MNSISSKIRIALGLTSGALLLFPSIGQAQDFVPGEVIVKFKSQENTQSFSAKMTTKKDLLLKGNYGKLGVQHFAIKDGKSVEQKVNDLRQDPDVEYAEPNYYFRKLNVDQPSNPISPAQMQALVATGEAYAGAQAVHAMGSDCVNDAVQPGDDRPIVAVIDTGLDYNHDAFVDSEAVWINTDEIANNGIDDDGNGYVDDRFGWNFVANNGLPYDDSQDGHGTHVSGIALSVCHDIYNPPFVKSKIRIMPLKFLDAYGVGKTSDAIKAIYYAVNNGAKVLNNSWGGTAYSSALHEAITFAYNSKVAFVAAAGNASSNNDSTPMYPASYNVPNVIATAAITNSDNLAWFSNYGVNTVQIAASGVAINSTVPGGYYDTLNGTSMATPFISGTAAMMAFYSPEMTGYQMKSIILQESDYRSQLASKVSSQAKLDASNAINVAKNVPVDDSQPSYSYSNNSRELASEMQGGGCGMVAKVVSEFSSNQRGGGGSGGAKPNGTVFILLGILSLPVLIYQFLRSRQPQSRRKYERYKIDSSVSVTFGDKQLVGSISTISLGGVQLNTDALLSQGGIVSMKIQSPDGKGTIEVEGKVVWSEAHRAYGVQFQNAQNTVLGAIRNWSRALTKAS